MLIIYPIVLYVLTALSVVFVPPSPHNTRLSIPFLLLGGLADSPSLLPSSSGASGLAPAHGNAVAWYGVTGSALELKSTAFDRCSLTDNEASLFSIIGLETCPSSLTNVTGLPLPLTTPATAVDNTSAVEVDPAPSASEETLALLITLVSLLPNIVYLVSLLVTHAGVRARLEAWLGVTKLRSVRDTLQQAVRLSEQRFEAQALVLARLPAVMARITAAVATLSDLRAEVEDRTHREPDRAIRHEQDVVALNEHNDRLEDELCSLQGQMAEHFERSARVDEQIGEEVVRLMEQRAHSEARLEKIEGEAEGQLLVIQQLESELLSVRTSNNDLLREQENLYGHLLYVQTVEEEEEEEYDAEVERLTAELAALEVTIQETTDRAYAASSKADVLEEDLAHVESASHVKQQVLYGDIAAAHAEQLSLSDSLTVHTADYSELAKSCAALETARSLLCSGAQHLETELAQRHAEATHLRSETLRNTRHQEEEMATAKLEQEDLAAAHAAAEKELAELVEADARTQEETRCSVETLREKHAQEQARHDEATATLKDTIAANDARIDELKASYFSSKKELEAKKVALDARHREYAKESAAHGERFDLIMEVTREAKLDRQEYDSKLFEASNRQKKAEKDAAAAQERARKAAQCSQETAKEMVISKHAFNTQIKDLRAEADELSAAHKDLDNANATLRDDNRALRWAIEKMQSDYEDRKRPLLFRMQCAEEDLQACAKTEAEVFRALDTQLRELKDKEAQLAAKNDEYKVALLEVEAEIDNVHMLQQEAEDATFAAQGQALALEQLLLTPGSGTVATPTFSSSSRASSRSPSASPEMPATPSDDDIEMLFDASFEEDKSVDIAESVTLRNLAGASGVGLGLAL